MHPLFSADNLPGGLNSYAEKKYNLVCARYLKNLPEFMEKLPFMRRIRKRKPKGERVNIVWNNPEYAHKPERIYSISFDELFIDNENSKKPGIIRKHYLCGECSTYCINGRCGFSLNYVPEDNCFNLVVISESS